MTVDDLSIWIGCGSALVIKITTLLRVLSGSSHKFVVKILTILIGSNIATLAAETV